MPPGIIPALTKPLMYTPPRRRPCRPPGRIPPPHVKPRDKKLHAQLDDGVIHAHLQSQERGGAAPCLPVGKGSGQGPTQLLELGWAEAIALVTPSGLGYNGRLEELASRQGLPLDALHLDDLSEGLPCPSLV